MAGRWSLSALHATLIIGLSGGQMLAHSVLTACDSFPNYPIIIVVGYGALPHVQEWPLTFSRPTDRNAEPAIPKRDVASQSARG